MDPYRKVSIWRIQIVLLVVLFMADHCVTLREGESCIHQGEQGACVPFSKCMRGTRITICSYSALEAIVCCPKSQQTQANANRQANPLVSTIRGVERKSVQMCNEYKKLATDSVSISSLTLNPTLVQFEVPKCEMTVKLIVGGNVTKPGEFPHMAAIGFPKESGGYSFDCGGSLISDKFVLTAAHCYADPTDLQPTIVRLGEQNLASDDDGAEPVDYNILRFIRHPEYRVGSGKYNDIALIQLSTRAAFTKFIRPACLYDSDTLKDRTAIATGFGLVQFFGSKSEELRKVMLNIYENNVCNDLYRSNRLVKQGIKNTQLCVGELEGGKDTCQGDSGGPLQVTGGDNQCTYYIIGVTSFGNACGFNTPAIYTRVYPYLNWIEEVVWP